MQNSKSILALVDSNLILLEPTGLEIRKTFTKSAIAFAINFDEGIAVSTGKKVLFFAYNTQADDFVPAIVGKSNEISFPDQVEKLSNPNPIITLYSLES